MSVKRSQYSFELIGLVALLIVVAIVFVSIFYKDNPKDINEMNIARHSVENIATYGQKVAQMGEGNRIKVAVEIPTSTVNISFTTGYVQINVETSKGVFDFTKESKQHFAGYNFTSNGNIMNGMQEVYFEFINGTVYIYPPSMRENYLCGEIYRQPFIKNMGSSYSNANITCDFGSSLIDQPCHTQMIAGRTLTAINVRCIDAFNAGNIATVNFFMYNVSNKTNPLVNINTTNGTPDGKYTYALNVSRYIYGGMNYTINVTCYNQCFEEVTPNTYLKNTTNLTVFV